MAQLKASNQAFQLQVALLHRHYVPLLDRTFEPPLAELKVKLGWILKLDQIRQCLKA